jgi:N-acetylglucosaminyldiphosphoundecaprenol N-acetyl-beta-D-mannosaminyltransferase
MKDFDIFASDLRDIDFSKSKIINTINPHSYCVAKNDSQFGKAIKESDILLPDGIGIVFAQNFLYGTKIRKIAGFDLFVFLMNKLNNSNGSVFFLGSTSKTLERIALKSSIDFPNVSVSSFSPPFKDVFSKQDSKLMVNKVNDFQPDVLFVGMTAPKQEKWVYQFKDRLKVKNICSIGAVFDFYSGNTNRAPKFMIKFGLEWLHRSITNRRLLVRNFISNPKFILYILKIKFSIK